MPRESSRRRVSISDNKPKSEIDIASLDKFPIQIIEAVYPLSQAVVASLLDTIKDTITYLDTGIGNRDALSARLKSFTPSLSKLDKSSGKTGSLKAVKTISPRISDKAKQ